LGEGRGEGKTNGGCWLMHSDSSLARGSHVDADLPDIER
jgi:hypothetical protein